MKSLFKPLLVAGLLACVGFTALAQTAPQQDPVHARGMMHHDRMDPAKIHEMVARRQAELKAKLKLTANQENAWADYVAAMQPPADMATRMGAENRRKVHEEMAALTTPERIDRMRALKAQRDAEIAKREDATKALYSALSAEQQKVLDANPMRQGPGDRHHAGHAKAGQNS